MEAFFHAAAQLPASVSGPLARIRPEEAVHITEIRLRAQRPPVLTTPDGPRFAAADGRLTAQPLSSATPVSPAMLQNCFQAICGYSVHSFSESIAHGFVPMPGGHRAGLCGTAYIDGDGMFALKNITSINIRIARTRLVRCDAKITSLLRAPRIGLLIAGEPGSGKTTLLRAVIETLSRFGRKTAVVDERFEIAPAEADGFCAAVPLHCDVLSGYPKHIGMQHALRTLSPDVLVCDEVGTLEEIEAISQTANGGIGLVATIHAQDIKALCRRPQYTALMKTGAFSAIAFLKGRRAPGEISEVRYVEASV